MKRTALSLLAAVTLLVSMLAGGAPAQPAKPASDGAKVAGMSRERLARIAPAMRQQVWIDPKEGLAAVLLAQGPSSRVPPRMLYKNLVYGAIVR